jgi:hypothetical protein
MPPGYNGRAVTGDRATQECDLSTVAVPNGTGRRRLGGAPTLLYMCWGLQRDKLPPRQRRNWLDALRLLIHSARKDYEHWLEVYCAMIEKRTVFILGAGASCPYGLPTANELRCDIIRNFRTRYGDHCVTHRETEKERTARGYPTISDAIAFLSVFDGPNNMESVDLFLSRQPRFREVGKLAILLSILHHERESRFAHNMKEPGRDWYSLLYDRMTRESTGKDSYKELARNQVAFITFNYDRSLEHFLFRSLHSFEDATPENVKEQIDQIMISHVYGKLSLLPWQDNDTSKVLGYGDDASESYGRLPSVIQNLYVVHEERTNPELEKARTTISEAERIFFLGFGYADENLKVLGIPATLKPTQLVYGTTMGFTEKERKDMQLRLADGLRHPQKPNEDARGKVHLKDCDSVALLREFL